MAEQVIEKYEPVVRYKAEKDPNGRTKYYRIEEDGEWMSISKRAFEAAAMTTKELEAQKKGGKKKASKKAQSDEVVEVKSKKVKSPFKQSRWTRVHEQGQGDYKAENNVLDITIGKGLIQANVTYSTTTIRTIEKAAKWLLSYLESAKANTVVELAGADIRAKAAQANKDTEQITAEGEGWSCTIENMGNGEFKAQMNWKFQVEVEPETKNEEAAV